MIRADLWSDASGTEDPVTLSQGFCAALPQCCRDLRHSWWEQCRCKTTLTRESNAVVLLVTLRTKQECCSRARTFKILNFTSVLLCDGGLGCSCWWGKKLLKPPFWVVHSLIRWIFHRTKFLISASVLSLDSRHCLHFVFCPCFWCYLKRWFLGNTATLLRVSMT